MSKQTNGVASAEQTLAALEVKRAACVKRGTELQDERTALAFSAHANNDAKAKTRLEQVHTAIATHASELASLDAALKSAGDRVAIARRAEALADDRAEADELRKVFARFQHVAKEMDQHLLGFALGASEWKRLVDEIHRLGRAGPPTSAQYLTFSQIATAAVLMGLPWSRTFGGRPAAHF
jgi:hypothetical protein